MRSRIVAGAVLWTIGLFAAALAVWGLMLMHHPGVLPRLHAIALQHGYVLVVVIVGGLVAGLLLVRRAISPLTRLRRRLSAVRAGEAPRVDGAYPSEVQPLVDDMNALLEHQEQAVRRAVARAGDLAHGLKTPLAVLVHEADRAEAAGHADLAASLREQIQRMQGQVDYHLAQARAAASGATPGATSSVADAAGGLVRTLQRLHAERGLRFEVDVSGGADVRVQREDLEEMLGNLLDNACKWTRSRVSVRAVARGDTVRLEVEDDGPGVPPPLRASVLERGVRADEASAGSGFGLAIVRELAELYGGEISLEPATTGGLRAVLTLPRTHPPARPPAPGVRS